MATTTSLDALDFAALCLGLAGLPLPPVLTRRGLASDRRQEGGGIAWLVKASPPPGKLIKIVATALSDEHVFNLEGGRVTKAAQPARGFGGYTLNPKGQPHSAFIGSETVSLVIYRGEPDEITSLELVDLDPATEGET